MLFTVGVKRFRCVEVLFEPPDGNIVTVGAKCLRGTEVVPVKVSVRGIHIVELPRGIIIIAGVKCFSCADVLFQTTREA